MSEESEIMGAAPRTAAKRRGRSVRRLGLLGALVLGACLLWAPSAFASAPAPAPAWTITSVSGPTNFAPGSTQGSGGDEYFVTATNVGGAPSDGSTITLTDTLPAGVALDPQGALVSDEAGNHLSCSPGPPVTCTYNTNPVTPGEHLYMTVPVDVAAGAPASVTNLVSVSGGGGGGAVSATDPTTISASAPVFGFVAGTSGLDGSVTNADGSTDTQAGSHPYQATVNMNFPTVYLPASSSLYGSEQIRDVHVNLPQGVVINPGATPVKCTEAQLETDIISPTAGCPLASAVGTVTVSTEVGGLVGKPSPLYNMVAPAGVPAELAFDAVDAGIYVHLMGSVRTGGDYGLSSTSNDILAKAPILGIQATLWGSPSDPSHDPDRGLCAANGFGLCPVAPTNQAFLTLPSACSGPVTTTASVDSWENPGNFAAGSFLSHDGSGNPVGVTGCQRLDFRPSISVQPDTSVADSPTGLSVDLSVPQNGLTNPSGLGEGNLKTAVVTLPAGVSVSPSAANGLTGCSEAQIGLDNANEPSCPAASKIGTVQVRTPLLADPMVGGIYVAQQGNAGPAQGSNPFRSLLAIYVTAEADGALIKLAGHVVADPVTGQLTTTFDNNPELPFSDFKLDFFGGPGAALAMPDACGTYTSSSSLSPWSGTPAATSSDSFDLSSGCVSGFSPTFMAGTVNPQAGAYTPFTLSFSRSDTDQELSGLRVTLPPGMLAKLAGVAECSDAQLAAAAANTGTAEQASPSCPAGSQVGTVQTGAGPGTQPLFVPGKAYLTGPYKGAPYGLAVVVPALAGPYDLGTVVVRQALYVDPTTAQVTAVSDPFPTILQGIPLRIRRIDVSLNRPDFTINPTSCNPMSVAGTLTSVDGLSAPVSSRFQVSGCQALGFSPKLKMALTGKGKTRSADHPTLVSTLTQPFGQANLHSAKVTLPLSMALDPNNSQHVCNYDAALAVHGGPVPCPASTIVGSASALTPLLSQPLTGKVYLVQGIRFSHGNRIRTLPSLLVPLRGQIALDLRANTSVDGASRLVTTFPAIPDAPVSKFTLTITGGKKGLLVITGRGRTICKSAQTTLASLGAQSGKTESSSVRMSTPCGKAHKAKKRRHDKHRRGHK